MPDTQTTDIPKMKAVTAGKNEACTFNSYHIQVTTEKSAFLI